jgi:protein tyrosine phosphatase
LQKYIDFDKEHINKLFKKYEKLDRYSDIKPYIHNKIFINTINKYINASPINIIKNKYFIATQGPLTHTIEDFWTMIDEYNCKVIVMICNLKEDGKEKCAFYYDEKFKMIKYKICIESVIKEESYTIRIIKLLWADGKLNLGKYLSKHKKIIFHQLYEMYDQPLTSVVLAKKLSEIDR